LGNFLCSISLSFNGLTIIFKDLISEISGVSSLVSFFSTLKSSEVSSLPSLIFLVISLLFLQILTSTVLPTSV